MLPYKAGTIIKFTYLGSRPGDQYKEVLILHPFWNGKVHALDLGRMDEAERQVVEAVFDPDTYEMKTPHRLPLVNDIVSRMNVLDEVVNPTVFYQKFVKVFLKTTGDCYRQYFQTKMTGVQVVKLSSVKGTHLHNINPLFHK